MNSLVAIEHIKWLATTIMMIFLLPQSLKFYLNLILIIFCDIFKTPLHLKNSTKKKKAMQVAVFVHFSLLVIKTVLLDRFALFILCADSVVIYKVNDLHVQLPFD